MRQKLKLIPKPQNNPLARGLTHFHRHGFRYDRLVTAVLLSLTGTVHAQTAQIAQTADVQKPDNEKSPSAKSAEAANATPYIDRVLNLGESDSSKLDIEFAPNPEGWPRAIRIDLQWAKSRTNGINSNAGGVNTKASLDTPNFGTFTLDGQFGHSLELANGANTGDQRRWPATLTLTQLGLPVAGGWLVNNTLGILAPAQIAIARQQPRIGLPTRALEGATTEWQSQQGVSVVGTIGRVGQLEGYPTPSFRPTGGDYIGVGGQTAQRFADGVMTSAINVTTVRGALNELGLFSATSNANTITSATTPTNVSFDSLFFAQRYQQQNFSLQANVVSATSSTGEQRQTASGVWIDADYEYQRHRYSGGLFRLEPKLNWAGMAMNSDVEGGYARYSYHTLRLSTDLSLEALRPVSHSTNSGASGTYLSGNLRYQISRDTSTGAGLNVRDYNGRGWQAYSNVQSRNAWGTGRLQIDLNESTGGNHAESLSFDQTFHEVGGLRLSTTLALTQETTPDFKRKTVLFSLAGGLNLLDDLTLDANLQTRRTISGPSDQAHTATIGVNWYFSRNWSLTGSVIIGSGRTDNIISLDPLAAPTVTTQRPSQHSYLLTIRYENRAGTPVAPLGGRIGGGGARVSGIVYLDANANGMADANEVGVPNLTVLLDGKFTSRTDAQGRFEFPFVGTGFHTLSAITDNLPLPWSMVNDGLTRFEVTPREAVRVNLPAVK